MLETEIYEDNVDCVKNNPYEHDKIFRMAVQFCSHQIISYIFGKSYHLKKLEMFEYCYHKPCCLETLLVSLSVHELVDLVKNYRDNDEKIIYLTYKYIDVHSLLPEKINYLAKKFIDINIKIADEFRNDNFSWIPSLDNVPKSFESFEYLASNLKPDHINDLFISCFPNIDYMEYLVENYRNYLLDEFKVPNNGAFIDQKIIICFKFLAQNNFTIRIKNDHSTLAKIIRILKSME